MKGNWSIRLPKDIEIVEVGCDDLFYESHGGDINFLLVIRAALEDKFLQKKLKGYKEYAQKTKYKLVPFIW